MVLDNDYYMLVKKRHLNTTTPKLTNQNEKKIIPNFFKPIHPSNFRINLLL
jgi:hypothetical protein